MDRKDMIESVRIYLKSFGEIGEKEKRILEAMEKVDRMDFVEKNYKKYGYLDQALPCGEGQTISQPSTVARMLQLLDLEKGENVLEIGTGSGWNAGLLGYLVKPGRVLSLELIDELKEKAEARLKKMENVEVRNEDFRKIKQSFDKVVFTAGIGLGQEKIVEGFLKRVLVEGGVGVCPFRFGPLIIFKKNGKLKKEKTEDEYQFVELVL